jgi:8-oxo-dGTP pyrophosphatase MutT (NUDIX family)
VDTTGRDVGDEVPVLNSATVLVLRRASRASVEVLLLRRNDRSGFVAGVTLYPGGAIDPLDALVPWNHHGTEHPPSGHGLGAIAAARECFEEAGILLAADQQRSWAGPHHHAAVSAGASFGAVFVNEGLHVPIDRFFPFGRWVTPRGASRRYDTQFFIVEAPPNAEVRVDGREIVHADWWDPHQALAAERDGQLRFVTPTRKTLARLVAFGPPPGMFLSTD